MSRPLDHSVILPQHLLVGELPRHDDVEALRALGVTAVLSLLHPSDPVQVPASIRQAFTFEEVSIVDSYLGGVPTEAHLERAVGILRRWRQDGHVIYLHCMVGQGRSPLVAMAYLVMGNDEERDAKAHRLTAAIAHVRTMRPKADPNVHQLGVLCNTVKLWLDPIHA